MIKLKIGVIEDETVIAKTICLILKKLGYETSSVSPNYNRAVKMMEEEKPDLLLIDINLGGGKDGIDFAHFVREKYTIPLIFLTANSDATTIARAKEVKPNAYLVKPFTKNDLFAAIEIAVDNFSDNTASTPIASIMVKDGYDFIKLFLDEILFIEHEQNYAVFNLTNGKKTMIRSTINEMMERLPEDEFMKVNRGAIINLKHISTVKTTSVLIGENEFSIAKNIREELIKILNTLS